MADCGRASVGRAFLLLSFHFLVVRVRTRVSGWINHLLDLVIPEKHRPPSKKTKQKDKSGGLAHESYYWHWTDWASTATPRSINRSTNVLRLCAFVRACRITTVPPRLRRRVEWSGAGTKGGALGRALAQLQHRIRLLKQVITESRSRFAVQGTTTTTTTKAREGSLPHPVGRLYIVSVILPAQTREQSRWGTTWKVRVWDCLSVQDKSRTVHLYNIPRDDRPQK